MFSPQTPTSSPLAHLSTQSNHRPQMFHPSPSSPLASSSPSNAVRTRRREYKSHSSSRSGFPSLFPIIVEDTPQKQFLRDRFKARCFERVKESRARALEKGRANSSVDGSSSDGFDVSGDFEMEEDDDNLDDELYRRVVMNEQRKAYHSKKVSLEQDFGSSIDPNMHEDMERLEMELTGRAPSINAPSPPSDELDDAQILEYLAELEETHWEGDLQRQRATHIEAEGGVIDIDTEEPGDLEREFTQGNDPRHPSPSRSMYSDFQMSSPFPSPTRSGSASTTSPQSPLKSLSAWSCPFCSSLASRAHIACLVCRSQYPLEHAEVAWMDPESHPEVQNRNHVPLVTSTPSESGIGVIMLCGAPGCDWCFAL